MSKMTECPVCLSQVTKVLTTRYTKKLRLVKRHCVCMACKNTFVTAEIEFQRYLALLAAEALLNLVLDTLLSESGKRVLLRLNVFRRLEGIVNRKEAS